MCIYTTTTDRRPQLYSVGNSVWDSARPRQEVFGDGRLGEDWPRTEARADSFGHARGCHPQNERERVYDTQVSAVGTTLQCDARQHVARWSAADENSMTESGGGLCWAEGRYDTGRRTTRRARVVNQRRAERESERANAYLRTDSCTCHMDTDVRNTGGWYSAGWWNNLRKGWKTYLLWAGVNTIDDERYQQWSDRTATYLGPSVRWRNHVKCV